MVRVLCCLITFCVCFTFQSTAQDRYQEELQHILDTASEKAATDYIIENFYQMYSSDFQRGDSVMQWMIQVGTKNGWSEKKAYGHLYRGIIQFLSGDYKRAIKFYLSALNTFDSLKDFKGIGRTKNEMAVFYHKTGNLDKAYECLDDAYAAGSKARDTVGLGTTLSHRLAFLEVQGKYDEAKPFIDQVLEIRQKTKDSVGLGYIYLDLAEYELNKGNVEKSLAYVAKSTDIRKKIGDKQGVVVNIVIVGENYFGIKQYRKAIPYFKRCIQEAKAIGFADLVSYSYDMLQKSYVALGDYKSAYENQSISHAIKDSIFNIQKARAISEIETKYETAKKEQKITVQNTQLAQQKTQIQRNIILIVALIIIVLLLIVIFLLSRNRYRKKQAILLQEQQIKLREAQIDAALQSQEEERRRFAEDLHDGFGQLISSLRLNIAALEDTYDLQEKHHAFDQAEHILREMHQEIRNIAFNLMPTVLIKNGLVPAVKEFALRINQTGKIRLEVGAFDFDARLSEIMEISLYRVIQEWVNNVIKYAEAQHIDIQFVMHEDELSLTLEDDGKGFDLSVLQQGKGNGWRNIQSRLHLVGGDVEIDSRTGQQGTVFMVTVPLQSINKEATMTKQHK